MIKAVKNIIATIINVVVIIICGFVEAVCKVTIINVLAIMGLLSLVKVDVMVTPIKEDK